MRKHLLPGNDMLIYHLPTGQTADRAGNSTSLSFACQPREAAPANHFNHLFSATGIAGKVPVPDTPVPGKPGKTLPTRVVSPAGTQRAGKIIARQPVSAGRKSWSMPERVQGILADICPMCCQPGLILTRLLPATPRPNNLIQPDYSIITFMHERRWPRRRRPVYY